MEISKLNEDVKRLKGELKNRDQGMETLMAEKEDLVRQVMNWEVEFTRGLDIAKAVDKALAKFKNSNEFIALLKKDHDTKFDVRVEAIFYNIWAHY